MVFDGLGFGGIERVGVSYAKMLVEMGHDVTLINLQPMQDALESEFPDSCEIRRETFGMLFQPDAFLPAIKKWWWGKYLYPLANLIARCCLWVRSGIARCIRRERFDVVIAFSGHIRDLTYVAYGLVKGNKRVAWLHGSLADYLLMSYAFGFLYKKIENLCVVSTNDQVFALQSSGLQDKVDICHIYNPVDQMPSGVDEGKVRQLKVDYGDPLVMVGRFGQDKDQPTVIRALRILRDIHGISKHLIFVGDGPTRAACESLADELGIAELVHFVGAKQDVDNYYLASLVAIHSSPAEGQGMVLLEAMRDGIPVVATNSLPGVPEILGANEYGLMCQVGSPEDMADKLARMITNEDLRASYVMKGKERVADYAPQVTEQKVMEMLDGIGNAC